MKVVIVSTIRGKSINLNAVQIISNALTQRGHEVCSDHILKTTQQELSEMSESENVKFHKNILSKIRNSDVVIAECSYQSMSVGYLISFASSLGKIVIIFYRPNGAEPNLFLTINATERTHVIEYSDTRELSKLTTEYIDFVSVDKNIRFNLFLSSEINAYLNWVSKKFSLSKSTFIRRLILDQISNDPLYRS